MLGRSFGIQGMLVALSLMLGSASAGAEPKKGEDAKKPRAPVSLSDVKVGSSSALLKDVEAIARKEIEADLAALDWGKSKPRRRYSITVTVAELGSLPAGQRSLVSSCVVSATLHGERGDLLATLQGKARAEDAASVASETERAVLAAALRSALSRVPDIVAAGP